jgi:hypothetical protein
MPDSTDPTADGTQVTASVTTPEPQVPAGKTFTQADLDRIVAERVARAKPADYDEAKAALEELNARKEGEKTELQKLQEAKVEADRERDEARSEAAATKREAAIMLEAVQQGADAELVVLALKDSPDIKLVKGEVEGAKEAVEKLLEKKPNLKVGGPTRSGGSFEGANTSTVAEEIAALEREGTPEAIRKARDLKISQMITST